MIGYPYWARVLVDRPDNAPFRRGDVVVVGGPISGGGAWIYDPDFPDLPWPVRNRNLMRLARPVDEHVPHAGETHNGPFEYLRGRGWSK
jgi:hypothetical protein